MPFIVAGILLISGVGVSALTFGSEKKDTLKKDPTAIECPDFTHTLYLGKTDANTKGEITRLQKYLRQFPSLYPERAITGKFDDATEFGVRRLQKKYKLATPGLSCKTGYGVVGKNTRKFLNNNKYCPKPVAPRKKVSCSGLNTTCPTFSRSLSFGNSDVNGVQGDVTRLQCFLSGQNLGYSAITGYFGPSTRRAVQKWQARYGIAYSGAGYGRVGPATRRAIVSVCSGGPTPVSKKQARGASDRYSIAIRPSEGVAPLQVALTLSINATTCTSYELRWGDGSRPAVVHSRTATSGCVDTPVSRYFTHTYTTPGAYTVSLKNGNAALSNLKVISESQIIVK